MLFSEPASGVVKFSVVPGTAEEKQQLAVAAFENGWHGIWVFDREPNRQQLSRAILNGEGIGKEPGAVELLINGSFVGTPWTSKEKS